MPTKCPKCGREIQPSEIRRVSFEDMACPTHQYERDASLPEWYGWHACRRGLGGNLYRLGIAEMVIQRILRHANVSTTTVYYIKTAADDVRSAMARLESSISKIDPDTFRTPIQIVEKAI